MLQGFGAQLESHWDWLSDSWIYAGTAKQSFSYGARMDTCYQPLDHSILGQIFSCVMLIVELRACGKLGLTNQIEHDAG